MRNTGIGKRLKSVAELIRRGAVLADIGTDHAYLPIYLLKNGGIARAFCSDINPGPPAKARENIEKSGLADKTELCLTSGCIGTEEKGITDYAICGMGGELIADIISASPHLRKKDIRLILQPMTKPEHLRKFLWREGFVIENEVFSSEEGKRYVAMQVSYVGEPQPFDECDAWFGKCCAGWDKADSDKMEYIAARAQILKKIADGKQSGGIDASAELDVLSEFYGKYGGMTL